MKRLLAFIFGLLLTTTMACEAGMSVTNCGVSPFSSEDTITVYSDGTVYTITNTQAPIDFGTTDPSITITKPGTYLIMAHANWENVGATYALNRTITTKLRRTNNTAADLAGSSTAFGTGIITALSGVAGNIHLPTVLYTTINTDDIIQIFGGIDTVASAGSTTCTEASIVAVRLH